MSAQPITLAIIGAGSRGMHAYGKYCLDHPEEIRVVAVADPRDYNRNEMAKQHNIPTENVFTDWRELLSRPKLADAVVISTIETMHKAPAIKAAELGYHILLEKPMAPDVESCKAIVQSAKKHKVILMVCHVLRYAKYFAKIKELVDSGRIGNIVSIQHLEGVGWWHQAHSFVRGNFRNVKESSFMLLAKSCHDMDFINWLIGKKCLRVSSFGDLKHFRPENKPAEAADRCIDCILADDKCPYSAKKFYFDKLNSGEHGWPLAMLITEFTEQALTKALREGPYGRCVYACDNDVVDHQVVAMEYEDRISASFTMCAFTPHGRFTRIFGTKGFIEGKEGTLRILDFTSGQWEEIEMDVSGGHSGGDEGLMQAFIQAVRTGDERYSRTGPDVTLESHLITFAAEQARLEKRVVEMKEFE